jgi:hypothetical protein
METYVTLALGLMSDLASCSTYMPSQRQSIYGLLDRSDFKNACPISPITMDDDQTLRPWPILGQSMYYAGPCRSSWDIHPRPPYIKNSMPPYVNHQRGSLRILTVADFSLFQVSSGSSRISSGKYIHDLHTAPLHVQRTPVTVQCVQKIRAFPILGQSSVTYLHDLKTKNLHPHPT